MARLFLLLLGDKAPLIDDEDGNLNGSGAAIARTFSESCALGLVDEEQSCRAPSQGGARFDYPCALLAGRVTDVLRREPSWRHKAPGSVNLRDNR
jgi:hypothetical protein